MDTGDNNRPNEGRGIALIILLALAMSVVLNSCKSKRVVEQYRTQHSISYEVKRDTAHVQTVAVDSTLHTWQVKRVTTYRPDGTTEREEVEERHKEQRAVSRTEVGNSSSLVHEVAKGETTAKDKAVAVDASPMVETTRQYKWLVWGVVVLAVVGIVVYLLVRYGTARSIFSRR